MNTSFTLNGEAVTVASDAGDMLLHVLREDLAIRSVRGTCGLGLCGSCTVIVDGKATASCLIPVPMVSGRIVRTKEPAGDDIVRRAFEEVQAFQCGYCTPAMVLTVRQLLDENPRPSAQEIDLALAANICRCGCYLKIRSAVNVAVAAIAAESRTS